MERAPRPGAIPGVGYHAGVGLAQALPVRRHSTDDPGGPPMHRFALALVLAMTIAGASTAKKPPRPSLPRTPTSGSRT